MVNPTPRLTVCTLSPCHVPNQTFSASRNHRRKAKELSFMSTHFTCWQRFTKQVHINYPSSPTLTAASLELSTLTATCCVPPTTKSFFMKGDSQAFWRATGYFPPQSMVVSVNSKIFPTHFTGCYKRTCR